jgi:hypothetical protein
MTPAPRDAAGFIGSIRRGRWPGAAPATAASLRPWAEGEGGNTRDAPHQPRPTDAVLSHAALC